VIGAEPSAATPLEPRRRHDARSASGWLVAGCLVVFVLGVFPTLPPRPRIVVDEIAYLGMARGFGGAAPMLDFQDNWFYQPGYSLLVSPAFWFGADPPEAAYRRVQVLNAALLSLLLVVIYLFLRRVGSGRRVALLAGLVASLYPPMLVQARYAMPEVAFALAFVAVLLVCGRLARAPSALMAALAGVATAGWPLLAPRGMPAAVAMALVVLLLAARRRLQARAAAIFVATLGAGWVLVSAFESRLIAAHWTADKRHDVGELLAKLLRPRDLADCARALLGQLWYLSAGTAGLALLGISALAWWLWGTRRLWARTRAATPHRREREALLLALAACAAAIFVASGLHMTPGVHPEGHLAYNDARIYGRYNEGFLPLLLALGVAALCRRRGTRSLAFVAVGLLALTAALALAWPGEPLVGSIIPDNVLALAPFLGRDRFCAGVVTIGAAAALMALLVAGARRLSRSAATGAAVALFLFVAARGLAVSALLTDLPSPVARLVTELGTRRVGYDKAVLVAPLYVHYQYQLPGVRFLAYDSRRGEPAPAPVVLSDHDPAHHAGSAFVWREEGQSLWAARTALRPGASGFDYRRRAVGADPLPWVWRDGVGRTRAAPSGRVAPLLGRASFRLALSGPPPVALQLALGSAFDVPVPVAVRLGSAPPIEGLLPPGGGILTVPISWPTDEMTIEVTSPPPRGPGAVTLRHLALADTGAAFATYADEGPVRGAITARTVAPLALACNEQRSLDTALRNSGKTAWPSAATDGVVEVRWLVGDAAFRTRRVALPVALLPGRTLEIGLPLDALALPAGRYAVEARLLAGKRLLDGVPPLRIAATVGDGWPLCACP
jgi:hypothetical protein